MTPRQLELCEAALVVFAIGLAAAFVAMGWTAWPPLSSDADYYVPPAFFLDQTGDWLNPLVRQAYEVPPVGIPEYNWHGLLLPKLLAELPGKLTWGEVYRTIGVLHGATLLCVGLACLPALRRAATPLSGALGLLAAVLGSAVLAAFLVAYSGRPEGFAVPWVALGAVLAVSPWGLRLAVQPIYGLLLGLAGLASPIPAAGAAGAYLIWLGQTRDSSTLFKHFALALAAGLAVLIGFFVSIVEIGFLEWIGGMRAFGAGIGPRYVEFFIAFKQRLLFDSNFPLAVLVLIGCAAAGASLCGRREGLSLAATILGALVLTVLAAYGLESAFKIYAFLPLLTLAVPLVSTAAVALSGRQRTFLAILLCLAFLPAGLGAARATLSWADYLIDGVRLDLARAALSGEAENLEGYVAVTPITLGLFEDLEKLKVCEVDEKGRLRFRGEACDAAVFDERVLGAYVGALRGYRCVARTTFAPQPRFLGLHYASIGLGYQAAVLVYDPERSDTALTQEALDSCPTTSDG